MASNRSRLPRDAFRALLWGGVFYLLLQVCAAVSVERWLPEGRDPEFAIKARNLSDRLVESPDSPLVLMLGSSRTALGFQAGAVHVVHDGKPAVVFNFGLSGGGPLVELLSFRRLLANGIRPQLLLIEILPAIFNQAGRHTLEETWFQGGRLRSAELGRLQRYHTEPLRLVRRWWSSRLLPWSSLHNALLATGLLDGSASWAGRGSEKLDEYGWEPHYLSDITDEQHRHYLEVTRGQYQESLGEFHFAEQPLLALNVLLDLCRNHHIPVALVFMPEGTEFQAMYPPNVQMSLSERIQSVSRDWQVPLIDARHWLADQDFFDGHHPLPSGAAVFTERFAREVIDPMLHGLKAPASPPIRPPPSGVP